MMKFYGFFAIFFTFNTRNAADIKCTSEKSELCPILSDSLCETEVLEFQKGLIDLQPLLLCLKEASSDIQKWGIQIRRMIHQNPEIMYEEYETSQLIQRILQNANIPFTSGWGIDKRDIHGVHTAYGTGVVAELGTGQEPCIALRADMDALPILEKTAVEFRSKVDGKMHACGHDVHTTMLLMAAVLLKPLEASIQGTIRFIWQPAEEGGSGAKMMCQEGVLKKFPPVKRIFALHVMPKLSTFQLGSRNGMFMAASGTFTIHVYGKGGHAAMASLAIDPIAAATSIVNNVYNINSREISFDLNSTGTIVFTQFHAGNAHNVIPSSVTIGGTLRSFSLEGLEKLIQRLKEIAEFTSKAFKCDYDIQTYISSSSVINDRIGYETLNQVGKALSHDGTVFEMDPTFGAEDFSYYQLETPGVFAFIGSGDGESIPNHVPTDYPLHSDLFAVDERVMERGALIHIAYALSSIKEFNSKTS